MRPATRTRYEIENANKATLVRRLGSSRSMRSNDSVARSSAAKWAHQNSAINSIARRTAAR